MRTKTKKIYYKLGLNGEIKNNKMIKKKNQKSKKLRIKLKTSIHDKKKN